MSELLQNVIDEKSIQKLMPAAFKDQIADHLKKLPDLDRKMRFGYVASDESIQKYVDRMSEKDIIFASFDHDLNIIAMAHFSLLDDGSAELGLSVDNDQRGKKFGSKLFRRAIVTSKVLGIKEIFVQCLAENKAMQHLAKKFDMKVVSEYGESEGRLEIINLTQQELLEHAMLEHITLYDFAFKHSISQFRKFQKVMFPK